MRRSVRANPQRPEHRVKASVKQFDYAAGFVGAKSGQSGKSAGRQRLALVIFGALFIVLFAWIAIADGIGHPSVPEGDVAIIEQVPDDVGTVSETEFKRALIQQAASGGLKKPPKPGEKKYDELKTAALGELLDTIWIQGEAEELGISVTPKQIDDELAQIKEQNFKTEAEYAKFLKTSRFTQEDVLARVKLQLLSTQIQEQVSKEAPPASESEISDYYDSAKETQYTSPESRDVRVIVNKDKAKAEEAKAQLEKDDSDKSWEKVATEFSEDPTTKSKGGLQPALTEELLASQQGLKEAVFGNPSGVITGPTDIEGKFFVIQVEKLNPTKVQTLKEVSAQIKSQLTQQVAQEVFSEFVNEYQSKWSSRTFCAEDFLIERCSNFVGTGHPATAPAACYEADPKGGLPADCPAPVTSISPQLPGTATILKPQGERLPQRPRPEGLKEAAEEALGLPEGATPPATGAPPTGE
ncbi:MAG TPA: peptidyl-prolyl cis-trans isomerase [Solirubrobacterales bacterium]|nr:peptidyl-prolyl cis-trans isomerase [Solirubrobacterales bacterium]